MTLSAVTAGDQATAAQYNAIKNHLEGDASSTLAWFLRCTASQNFVVKLSDAGGVQKFSIQDSAGAEVAQINSNGDFTLSGTFTVGALQLPTGTAPTPTADGEMWWDTDNDRLVIGDGASQVLIAATHAEAHTVASHSDTTATGAETETLTDGSNADLLHTHAAGWTVIASGDAATSGNGFDITSISTDYDLFRLNIYCIISDADKGVRFSLTMNGVGGTDYSYEYEARQGNGTETFVATTSAASFDLGGAAFTGSTGAQPMFLEAQWGASDTGESYSGTFKSYGAADGTNNRYRDGWFTFANSANAGMTQLTWTDAPANGGVYVLEGIKIS